MTKTRPATPDDKPIDIPSLKAPSIPVIYNADIGCWDRGKIVSLKAKNINDAINEATKILESTTFNPPINDPYVVQIRCNNKIVWDYHNGNLI